MSRRGRGQFRQLTAPLKDYYCAYEGAKRGQPLDIPKKVPGPSSQYSARLFDRTNGPHPENTVLVWTAEMLQSGAEPFRYHLTDTGATRLACSVLVQRIPGFHDGVM